MPCCLGIYKVVIIWHHGSNRQEVIVNKQLQDCSAVHVKKDPGKEGATFTTLQCYNSLS
jgi:hypothetical protein